MPEIIICSFLISSLFGLLGSFVLWKRYIYFSDGIAHTTMLAAVLSIVVGIPLFLAALINTALFSFVVFNLKNKAGNNAAIGVASSVMIALALIISYLLPGQFNLHYLLFGDILSVNIYDIMQISGLLIVAILFIRLAYKDLIILILNREIAYSRRARVKILEIGFLILLSFSVIISIKLVGALLVTSLILIPAMTARFISTTPVAMIRRSIFFAYIMNMQGIFLSGYFDIPFAPAVAASGGLILFIIYIIKEVMRWKLK